MKAGYSWRPYVLRAYFDTNMIIAESKGSITHPYLQFMMGHKGDIESRYTTNKSVLPPDMIEDMREAYRRSQEHLQTVKGEPGDAAIRDAFKRELLAVSGFTQQEISRYDLCTMSNEDLHNIVKQRLLGIMSQNGNKQKVINVQEIERYISEGWKYVAAVSQDRAVVKLPF